MKVRVCHPFLCSPDVPKDPGRSTVMTGEPERGLLHAGAVGWHQGKSLQGKRGYKKLSR